MVGNQEIGQIFLRTLVADIDDESAWKAVNELRSIGTREVFDLAIDQAKSPLSINRVRAIDVIAQLGNNTGQWHPFQKEAGKLVESILEDEIDLDVLHSCIVALGHLNCVETADSVCNFSMHTSIDIRHAVAVALGSMADDSENAASTLLQLLQDTDDDIRDWATFGIGVQSELDTPEIRKALVERLDDKHFNARCEAMVGLAKRKDRRALPLLLKCLDDELDNPLATEAATELLALNAEPVDWTTDMFADALRKKYSV